MKGETSSIILLILKQQVLQYLRALVLLYKQSNLSFLRENVALCNLIESLWWYLNTDLNLVYLRYF